MDWKPVFFISKERTEFLFTPFCFPSLTERFGAYQIKASF